MKILIAALMPLALAACAEPSRLPATASLGLATADPSTARGVSSTRDLFPDFRARPVTQPEDWTTLNRAQAPKGALE